jgi:putative transposase
MHNDYWVSFCYGEDELSASEHQKETLKWLKGKDRTWLAENTIGVDRGVARPVQTGDNHYDFTSSQKRHKETHEEYVKRYQKKMSRQDNRSNRRFKTRKKLARRYRSIANIRHDFAHKTSHAIVNVESNKVIVLEDLGSKRMTKKAKPKPNQQGGFDRNNARAKSGLNKAILDKGWCQIAVFLEYKAQRAGKVVFKVSPHFSSQECADCGHTHPNNRKNQSDFSCERCGHTDNADRNAAYVLKNRAINLILDSGTELSNLGLLRPGSDRGRGAMRKSSKGKPIVAAGNETSKKKRGSSALTCAA